MSNDQKKVFIYYVINSIQNRVPCISKKESIELLNKIYAEFRERYNKLSSVILAIPTSSHVYTHAMGMAHVWRELSRILFIQGTEEYKMLAEGAFMVLRLDYGLDYLGRDGRRTVKVGDEEIEEVNHLH